MNMEYNYKPKKILTDDDRALQTKLDKSITLESIKEFEEDQYKELMEKGARPHPNAKGYEEKK